MLLQMTINLFPWELSQSVQFLYVKRMYNWGLTDYSWYKFTWNISGLVGMCVVFPFFQWKNLDDNILIIFSNVSMIIANLLRGLAKEGWLFMLGGGVDIGKATGYTPIRAQIARCVSAHEVGRANALVSATESIAPILIDNIFTRLYRKTNDLPYPAVGSVYFVVVGTLVVAII